MLPKNDIPIYSLTLKSNEKSVIKFRPFLVKEEKIMLMAAQSKDEAEIKSAIKQILGNCVVEPQNFDPDDLSMFDVEWLLINLRIKSVGSAIQPEYICSNVVNEVPCNEPFTISIGIDDIKVIGDPKPDSKVYLSDKLGVIMRPPRFKIASEITEENSNEYDLTVLKEAIVSVFDDKQQYSLQDESPEEVSNWFDTLTKDQFGKIKEYLGKLPTFSINKEHTCKKCGFVHHINVDNLASFF